MEIFKALFLNKETGGERRKYFLQLLTNDWKWPELIPGNGCFQTPLGEPPPDILNATISFVRLNATYPPGGGCIYFVY